MLVVLSMGVATWASFVALNVASRLYQRARLGYAQAEAQRYVDTAQLFLAMGGGWWERGGLTQGGVELKRAAAR